MSYDATLQYLTELSARLIRQSEKTAENGVTLFTPDGVGNYDALWTRDFSYMVEYCGDLFADDQIRDCIEFLLAGRREDGWIPDRVERSGEAVYAAGAKATPIGRANLDNAPFLASAVYDVRDRFPKEISRWAVALVPGMEAIPLSPEGLVWNDPKNPHSPYGFTDTIGKTGRLFKESLLYWRACRQLAEIFEELGLEAFSKAFRQRCEGVEKSIDRLYDPASGIFYAAELDCRQPDVWGNAYGLYIGFPFPEEVAEGMACWLTENCHRCLQRGQVSHLPDGGSWDRLLAPVKPGEYQNGAYWATASGWLWYVLTKTAPQKAQQLMTELVTDFQTTSAYECVNGDYRKLPQYVVSATNVRGPVLRYCREQTVKQQE